MTETVEHLNPTTLTALVDGELSMGEREIIQEHLRGCPACALRVLSTTQLKAATAQAGRRFSPSPDALARLTATLHAQPQPKVQAIRRGGSFRVVWGALAAACLLAISLVGWQKSHQANTLAAELLDQHLATLSSGAVPQVISTDRHTVKPWFQGRLPFSFNLPEALPADTTLKGADFTYLQGQPAALLLFTIHKHEVSVFLTQRSGGVTLTTLPGNRSGFAIRSATTHDLRLVAVSDVNPADLDGLVDLLVRVQSPP
jgi:anti-sigma factor RsiW